MTVTLAQLEKFVDRWISAGGDVVQNWVTWEREAATFFGLNLRETGRPEIMHAIMLLVIGINRGTPQQVKDVVRGCFPSVLELANHALGHLPQYSAVLQAEMHFRMGQLKDDWVLLCDGDQCIVRSEFRSPTDVH